MMWNARLSLKDLFAIVAYFSVVSCCASQVGFDNAMFWLAVFASAILSSVFVFLTTDKGRRSIAPFVMAVPFLCCIVPIMSVALFTNSLLLLVASVLCIYRNPLQTKTACAVALISSAVGLAAGLVPGARYVSDLMALRNEFPIVSLGSRLQYERRRAVLPAANFNMSNSVSTGLTKLESNLDKGKYRIKGLRQIHDHQYENFVRATGFGIARGTQSFSSFIKKEPLSNIPFASSQLSPPADFRRSWRGFEIASNSDEVEQLHSISQYDFLDANAFGLAMEPVVRVVGFIEHGFHGSPVRGTTDPDLWTIERLELVSLLKFDEPRVYVLDHLPRMDQLSSDDVPTRPLDSFEADSLKKLWTDEDIVTTADGNDYRMLGSLRAASQCLDCHSVQRGQLLGAFTYVLHRADRGDLD